MHHEYTKRRTTDIVFHALNACVLILLLHALQCFSFLIHGGSSGVCSSLLMTQETHGDVQNYIAQTAHHNHCEGERESQVNELLHVFFTSGSNHFTVAENIVESYLGTNSRDDRRNPQPILIRCDNLDEELESDKLSDNGDWSQLFDPLFSTSNNTDSNFSLAKNQIDEQPHQNRRKKQSFKITIAYRGTAYCGWQIQPNNPVPSVQQTLIDLLDPILGSSTEGKSKKPIDIRVSGRTDAGVSAIAQVCRVRTLRSSEEVSAIDIQRTINNFPQSRTRGNLYCTLVERVSDKFHPTFCTRSRSYAYIIDAVALHKFLNSIPSFPPTSIRKLVYILNRMAKQIEGKELDFFGLSYGKVKTASTLCTLSRAQVSLVKFNNTTECTSTLNEALCFEFVGNRFLRRMIRIMVSTLLSLATQSLIDGCERNDFVKYENLFLNLVHTCDRKMSSRPAPPDGLIFVGATFDCPSSYS